MSGRKAFASVCMFLLYGWVSGTVRELGKIFRHVSFWFRVHFCDKFIQPNESLYDFRSSNVEAKVCGTLSYEAVASLSLVLVSNGIFFVPMSRCC
jgi:hypothetical protein